MKDYLQQANSNREQLVEHRRWLHQHPETGFDLEQTSRFVMERLAEWGIEARPCGKCGVTATIGGKRPGKVFLLRADIDALPLREESGLPFAATGDAAHCCGHDLHTAMLLGAARMLKENEDALSGTVKLMFQPAEEILSGAITMIEDGLLDNPKVDAAAALHIMPMIPTGQIAYNTGTISTSSDSFHIDIQGRGGHGAMPASTIDPIMVGSQIYQALQTLISRETDPALHAALSVCCFQAGTTHNIIPDTAHMKGTLRTYDDKLRAYLKGRLREVVESTARTLRAEAKLDFVFSTPAMVVDSVVVEEVAGGLRSLFGDEQVQRVDDRMSGSEDFSEVCSRVPSIYFMLGGGTAAEGHIHPLHHPQITFSEDALPVGAAALAQAAHSWLDLHAGK